RHTRFSRDWSSDVCSSDLTGDECRGDYRSHLQRYDRTHTRLHLLEFCQSGHGGTYGRFRRGCQGGGDSGRLYKTGRGNRLGTRRSEEHTSELQSREKLVCRLLLEKKTSDQER